MRLNEFCSARKASLKYSADAPKDPVTNVVIELGAASPRYRNDASLGDGEDASPTPTANASGLRVAAGAGRHTRTTQGRLVGLHLRGPRTNGSRGRRALQEVLWGWVVRALRLARQERAAEQRRRRREWPFGKQEAWQLVGFRIRWRLALFVLRVIHVGLAVARLRERRPLSFVAVS